MVAARAEIAALRALVRQRQLAGNGDQRPRSSCRRPAAGSSGTGPAYRGGACGRRRRSTVPVSTASPEYMTVMRSQVSRIRPRLCEMKIIDVPNCLPQALDQIDDAGLDRDVERGGRLVEQQQRRLRQQRHGDDDALLLAAGELVRIGLASCARDRAGAPPATMSSARCRPRPCETLSWISGTSISCWPTFIAGLRLGHRLLVDHGDLGAADGAQLLLATCSPMSRPSN